MLAAVMTEKKDEEPIVTFGPDAKPSDVSNYSLGVLKDIMKKAGVKSAIVSSTARDSTNQARVMYDNLVGPGRTQGVDEQRKLYGKEGDKVIDLFVKLQAENKNSTEIKDAMKQKIDEIGPAKVSKHAADPGTLNVFDVVPSSISNKEKFKTSAKSDSRVTRFLTPDDGDPGFHFEIPPSP